jgi:hypothetical protein
MGEYGDDQLPICLAGVTSVLLLPPQVDALPFG